MDMSSAARPVTASSASAQEEALLTVPEVTTNTSTKSLWSSVEAAESRQGYVNKNRIPRRPKGHAQNMAYLKWALTTFGSALAQVGGLHPIGYAGVVIAGLAQIPARRKSRRVE
jgi:hypothetical protein